MIKNMTTGSPAKQLWLFSLPMLFSVVFQQLYNVADSVIAGQFVGEDALAAVGASYPITMIFMAVATGCNIGCSVVISQLFGAGRHADMKTAVNTSLLAVGGLSLALTAAGLAASGALMRLLHTPGNIFGDSAFYLQVYIGGLFFLFLYNICTGIFTALGDSRTPLYFLIASSVGNILLDLWFVISLRMGVAGVAWATFAAQGAASLLAFGALLRRLRNLPVSEKAPLFSTRMLARIARIAVPSILQQSFVSVGNLFIQGLVNSYGSSVIAGYSAAIKLNTFSITSLTALSNGLSSFTAQNMGAKKPDRIRRGFRAGLVMAGCVAAVFMALFWGLSDSMVRLFMASPKPEALAAGVQFLRIVSPFYLVIMVKLMADSILRGTGCMLPFMVTTFSDLILRVVLAFILPSLSGPSGNALGSSGIWLSWPVGWLIACILSCLFYASGIWRRRAAPLSKPEEKTPPAGNDGKDLSTGEFR